MIFTSKPSLYVSVPWGRSEPIDTPKTSVVSDYVTCENELVALGIMQKSAYPAVGYQGTQADIKNAWWDAKVKYHAAGGDPRMSYLLTQMDTQPGWGKRWNAYLDAQAASANDSWVRSQRVAGVVFAAIVTAGVASMVTASAAAAATTAAPAAAATTATAVPAAVAPVAVAAPVAAIPAAAATATSATAATAATAAAGVGVLSSGPLAATAATVTAVGGVAAAVKNTAASIKDAPAQVSPAAPVQTAPTAAAIGGGTLLLLALGGLYFYVKNRG